MVDILEVHHSWGYIILGWYLSDGNLFCAYVFRLFVELLIWILVKDKHKVSVIAPIFLKIFIGVETMLEY